VEDLLEVLVWDEPDLSRMVTVRPDGMITVPLIGDVKAAGLTTDEIRNELATALARLVREPNVTVIVQEIRSYRVFVLGEVNAQGLYRLKDASDLLASLSLAGGPTRLAVKSDIKIIREYQERKGAPVILSASYDDITKKGDIAQNVALKNGDIVWVPRILIGDVNEWITNTLPLLDYLLKPAAYRDAYGDSNNLRFLKY
jgi:polysaccharide export outer membrane protein